MTSLDEPPDHDRVLHEVLRAAFEEARSQRRLDRLRATLQMLWADQLLETQSQVQYDLRASADLFVRQRAASGLTTAPPDSRRNEDPHTVWLWPVLMSRPATVATPCRSGRCSLLSERRPCGWSTTAYNKSILPVRVREAARMRIAQLNECTVCLTFRADTVKEQGLGEDFYCAVGPRNRTS